jgi:hypothetical protein
MSQNLPFVLFLLGPVVAGALLFLFVQFHRANKTSRLWWRLICGNALVFLFLSNLVFLAGETYYRFIYDTTDSIDYTNVSQQWFRKYYRVNSAGFRDNIEYSLRIQSGKRRVTFVGDSFTAGHGIKSVEDRFPNLIRAMHPEWEVHVMAVVGLDTGPEFRMLYNSIADGYQLDQVVLVYCLNDVADLRPDWSKAMVDLQAGVKHQNWIERNSYLVNTLYYRIMASHNPYLKSYYSFVVDAYRGAYWEAQKKRLTAFRDLVQSHHGRLLVVTFPFLNSLGPGYKFQFAHKELDRFWDGLNVPNLDLLSIYSNLPPGKLTVNRFDAHPNEYACLLAAKSINKFLETKMSQASAPVPAREP